MNGGQCSNNIIEWLGARGTQVTFSGKICFPPKVPEVLHVLFDGVVKQSPVFFWLVCTLFLRKTKTKYRSV